MSGHSKWQQIRHKKELTDKKRGQIFSKLSKLISLAAKKGVSPETNFELKNAIEKAKAFNLPNENIERAIKRAKEKETASLDLLQLEAIGPAGTAFIIEAISDRRNRTIAEIKNILRSHEIKMVPPNSIIWLFKKVAGDFIANNSVEIIDEKIKEKIKNFLEELDDHDEVKEIYSNLSNLW